MAEWVGDCAARRVDIVRLCARSGPLRRWKQAARGRLGNRGALSRSRMAGQEVFAVTVEMIDGGDLHGIIIPF